MAFATQISVGKKKIVGSTRQWLFPHWIHQSPLQSIPQEMPISVCAGCLCSTEGQRWKDREKSAISNSDLIAADKKQHFSFYHDPKLNRYKSLPDIFSLCFPEIISGTSAALWILHVWIISVALSYSFPPPPWPNLKIYPLHSSFIF